MLESGRGVRCGRWSGGTEAGVQKALREKVKLPASFGQRLLRSRAGLPNIPGRP
jgi:hypothetical protein